MIKNFKKGYFVFTAGDPRHESANNNFWCEHLYYAETKRELENFFDSYEGDQPFYEWLTDELDLSTYTEQVFNRAMKELSVAEMAGEYDFGITIYDLAKHVYIPVSPFCRKDLKMAIEFEVEEYKINIAPPKSLSKCERIKQLTEELHKLTNS